MEDLKGLKVNELKIELRNFGAKTSGKKAILIERFKFKFIYCPYICLK